MFQLQVHTCNTKSAWSYLFFLLVLATSDNVVKDQTRHSSLDDDAEVT